MWRRRRTDEDFGAELNAHVALEIDRLVADGLTPDAARAEASRRFGNAVRAREDFHERGRVVWLEQFARDVQYAWRGLWRSPAFASTTVLTLAVGLSLVTVVFAAFSAYVLRPFAVRDPYRLYSLSWSGQEAGGKQFRWKDYESLRERRDLFDDAIAKAARPISSNGQQVWVEFTSGNYFQGLGPRIAMGRGLVPDDARTPGGEPVAVLSDRAWANLFERDPSVLGRDLVLNGQKFVVVGVVGPEFAGVDDVPRDVWLPITMYGALTPDDVFAPSQPRQVSVIVRLRHDIEEQQAEGSIALEPFETRVKGRIDTVRADLALQATPARLTLAGVALFSPIFAAFGLVLVAACANASNVMLARANARHREIGIRLSIGASRGRIVRQLLTEGLLIAMLAGAAGMVLARVLLRLSIVGALSLVPSSVALRVRLVPFDFDYRVFFFSFGVAGAATLLFALLPALQATRVTLTDALRGQVTAVLRGSILRGLLITSQVAVSLLLLIIAATFIRNGTAIRSTDLGLDLTGVISVRQNAAAKGLVARAYDALAADSRVADVVVTSRNPLFGDTMSVPVRHGTRILVAAYTFVSPNYFSTMHVPVLHGRGFTREESVQEAPVAIISAAGAAAFWPGEDPIGKTIRLNLEPPGNPTVANTVHVLVRTAEIEKGSTELTIIGVAKDAVNGFVYEGDKRPHLYLPTNPTGSRANSLMAKGKTSDLTAEMVKAVVQPLVADPLTFDILSVRDIVDIQMFPVRAASWIGSLLSGIALALSVSGLYGVLTYTFGQRVKEIGIRMALGADARSITRLVVAQSARLAALGTVVGLLLAYAVVRVLSTLIRLDNVSVIDPGAFVAGIALTVVAVAVASYGPTRRALEIDPSSMLRADG